MVRNKPDINKILDWVLNDTDESECGGTDPEREVLREILILIDK